ncbi:hypothetical protein ACEUCK_10375, partial [Aeromonas veronii]
PAGMTTIGLSYSLVKISTKCAPALDEVAIPHPLAAPNSHKKSRLLRGGFFIQLGNRSYQAISL